MVGFSDLSDTDESAIDEIISQAQDACVLEQVSTINCSSFTDSVLPTDLESRFRKLKSFPVTKPKRMDTPPPTYDAKGETFSIINSRTQHNTVKGKPENNSVSDEQSLNFLSSKENPDGKMCLEPNFLPAEVDLNGKKKVKAKPKHGSVSPPPDSSSSSSHSSEESSMSSLFKPKTDEGKRSKQKSKHGSVSSPLSLSNSLMDSPSPPRKAGCFWCSPKKDSKKKAKENWAVANVLSDDFLSHMGSFSSKQQQKMLKKAMKEEQKISREAEKIVKWAKQASARMSISSIEDELSDH